MATSMTSEIISKLRLKTRKSFLLFSLILFSTISSFAVVPTWFGGTPTVTPHATSEDFKYGINQVGKVYVILFNYNIGAAYSSGIIKGAAIAGPVSTIISTWVINVPLSDINNTFTINAINQLGGNINLLAGHDYTFYFVAEDAGGNLQAAPVRIYMPTLPCPALDVAFGYTQAQQCVNKGAMLQLNFFPGDPNPDLS